MTWIALLLADPSPSLRLLILRDLLRTDAADPELHELAALQPADPLVADLLARQGADGAWAGGGISGIDRGDATRATFQALFRLGYLGFGPAHPAVARGAAYLFSLQQSDGSWPLARGGDEEAAREGYTTISLQTSLPLRALAACGYATDERAERAYEWLLAQRLDDGAWPTGVAAGMLGRVAGYRRLPHSSWGCRSNTTGALACLALHPQRRHSPAARRALDLIDQEFLR